MGNTKKKNTATVTKPRNKPVAQSKTPVPKPTILQIWNDEKQEYSVIQLDAADRSLIIQHLVASNQVAKMPDNQRDKEVLVVKEGTATRNTHLQERIDRLYNQAKQYTEVLVKLSEPVGKLIGEKPYEAGILPAIDGDNRIADLDRLIDYNDKNLAMMMDLVGKLHSIV